MPLSNEHFNPTGRVFDHTQSRISESDAPASGTSISVASSSSSGGLKAFIRNPVGQAAIMAAVYGIDGFLDFQRQNEYYGTPEIWPMDLAFIGVVVWLPAFLMLKRKGYVSAGALCLTALMNVGGIWQEVAAGNEMYASSSIIWHLIAFGVFARASWSLWKNRKIKSA